MRTPRSDVLAQQPAAGPWSRPGTATRRTHDCAPSGQPKSSRCSAELPMGPGSNKGRRLSQRGLTSTRNDSARTADPGALAYADSRIREYTRDPLPYVPKPRTSVVTYPDSGICAERERSAVSGVRDHAGGTFSSHCSPTNGPLASVYATGAPM